MFSGNSLDRPGLKLLSYHLPLTPHQVLQAVMVTVGARCCPSLSHDNSPHPRHGSWAFQGGEALPAMHTAPRSPHQFVPMEKPGVCVRWVQGIVGERRVEKNLLGAREGKALHQGCINKAGCG